MYEVGLKTRIYRMARIGGWATVIRAIAKHAPGGPEGVTFRILLIRVLICQCLANGWSQPNEEIMHRFQAKADQGPDRGVIQPDEAVNMYRAVG